MLTALTLMTVALTLMTSLARWRLARCGFMHKMNEAILQ